MGASRVTAVVGRIGTVWGVGVGLVLVTAALAGAFTLAGAGSTP